MAIDVSLKGVSGGDAACGWAVVQVDYDKEEEPVYAISGTMRAELEVQSTIKRAELWAFTMTLASLIGPSTIHTDKMGTIDGLWRGRRRMHLSEAEGCGCMDRHVGVADGVCREEWGSGCETREGTPNTEKTRKP